jgi:hypothetical protein
MTTFRVRTNLIQVPWNERKEKHRNRKSRTIDDIRKDETENEFHQKSWQLRDAEEEDEVDLDNEEDGDLF